ncbi:656_t:CDS:2 [Paraglomus occultum]|uniref:656_t:CDS:1 n=1 Tax=Paraglomus occultum TaxID=144539 RepID=A0A9N8YX21_9GLOM|nr:656_t:CDS:2 [Paraglomus occultum]
MTNLSNAANCSENLSKTSAEASQPKKRRKPRKQHTECLPSTDLTLSVKNKEQINYQDQCLHVGAETPFGGGNDIPRVNRSRVIIDSNITHCKSTP